MADQSGTTSFAVLIDAENTSPRYAQAIFDEITSLGEANVRRIYGDFSGSRLSGWDTAVQSLAILQHQQRSNTIGKNAADIALVIDAMDMMSKGKVDGFCLVTSDSDFTRLAQRLREDGLVVYGFGERKTPEAFRSACTRFIYLESLGGVPEKAITLVVSNDTTMAAPVEKHAPPSKAAPIILKAMAGFEDDEGWVPLTGVGSRIRNIAPDFDPRSFGQPKLSVLVEKSGAFDVKRPTDKGISIRAKAAHTRLAANWQMSGL